ncbi:MAG TPA: hypothetical protein VG675_07685 [Bryobacteraceae bacterium]|nr:hypothetical protein [Bryobacteraceae bacterium]
MPQLLTTSSTLMCPHGGTVTIVTANSKVRMGGDFAAMASDQFLIAGCTFNVAGGPHPCVTVQWVQTAQRSKVLQNPTLNTASTGLCVAADQAVQGAVQIVVTQQRVSGT